MRSSCAMRCTQVNQSSRSGQSSSNGRLTPRLGLNTVWMHSMPELTRKQQQILDFIQNRQRADGVAPTYQEIAERFGFRSPHSVTTHLRLLRQKGCLESESRKARSLRVTSPLAKLRSRMVDIPLFGSIPAGFSSDREQERSEEHTSELQSHH